MTLVFKLDKSVVEEEADCYVVQISNPEAFVLVILKAMSNPGNVYLRKSEEEEDDAYERARRGYQGDPDLGVAEHSGDRGQVSFQGAYFGQHIPEPCLSSSLPPREGWRGRDAHRGV